MYKILIDSSKRYEKGVFLYKDVLLIDKITGDIDVAVEVRTILEKNNLKLKDISIFEPNRGPGSFTGLKIGIAVSNVLNWALGKKTLENLDSPAYGGEPNIESYDKMSVL